MTVDVRELEDGKVEIDGRVYITAARIRDHIGVDPALVRDWKRRGLITGVRRWNNRSWYPLHQLENVEAATCGRTKPRTSARG